MKNERIDCGACMRWVRSDVKPWGRCIKTREVTQEKTWIICADYISEDEDVRIEGKRW